MSNHKTLGIPLFWQLLLLLFIGLKLSGAIDWSWWFVFAPAWGYVAANFLIGFALGFARAFRRARKGGSKVGRTAP